MDTQSNIPLLRLEGFTLLVLSLVFYARFGSSWWLFAGLLFCFDASMLGYLQGPKLGAFIYNCFHSYMGPALLLVISLAVAVPVLMSIALIWFAHIGLDRSLGYGLKSAEGFAFTHLGKLGKHA